MLYWIGKFFSDFRAHGRALAEVATVAIWSIVLCVGPYIRKLSQSANPISDLVFERGQLFLLTYGIFGSVFYLAFIKGDSHGAKKLLGFVALLLVIPIVMSVLCYEHPPDELSGQKTSPAILAPSLVASSAGIALRGKLP